MKLVLLGTGTPNAEPKRSGPAAAVVWGDATLLVDCGPGVVRRARAAAEEHPELAPERLSTLLLTHLHSDHTVGLPDLALTPWTLERHDPLRIWGPAGTAEMAAHVQAAWKEDVGERLEGEEPANDSGWKMHAMDVESGFTLEMGGIRATAFGVSHGTMKALGWRITGPGGTVVFSGDTAPFPGIEELYSGADILVHEVYCKEGLSRRDPRWRRYHERVHTSAPQLGRIATAAEPGLLVLTHVLTHGADERQIMDELAAGGWMGKTVLARDLDYYRLS